MEKERMISKTSTKYVGLFRNQNVSIKSGHSFGKIIFIQLLKCFASKVVPIKSDHRHLPETTTNCPRPLTLNWSSYIPCGTTSSALLQYLVQSSMLTRTHVESFCFVRKWHTFKINRVVETPQITGELQIAQNQLNLTSNIGRCALWVKDSVYFGQGVKYGG